MTDQAQPPKTATPSEALQKVDRVRDIIFGHQMRDYEQRFQLLQRDIQRLQQELDRLNEQLTDHNSEQVKKFQAFRQEMRQADDSLREEIRHVASRLTDEKVDRLALGELFVELGSHLKAGGSIVDFLKNLEPDLK
jgi:chromosome segregation ATPase